MDLRKSVLKPFKKLKGRLPGGRRKQDGRSGSEDNSKWGEGDVESEASDRNSYLHSEVDFEVAVEGGPSRGGSNVDRTDVATVDDPPTSTTPPISQSGKPDSA